MKMQTNKKGIKQCIFTVELKKLLIAAYVATISVSKNKFTKEEADTIDKMWLKLTDNLAGMGKELFICIGNNCILNLLVFNLIFIF